ncbi:Uncharacterised protein [uncultured archaeon]|nr:Uncharacterised protein [uncultured archaeon]
MGRIISPCTFRGMNRKKKEWIPMSGKKNKDNDPNAAETAAFHADDDNAQENPTLEATDEWEGEDDDAALMAELMRMVPKNVKLVDLAPDFVRPEGFLMVPRLNKKTGEVFPMTATFVGILHDIIPWKDNRGKERLWFACEATGIVPGTKYTGRDEQNKDFVKDVEIGNRIGISGSGAINALKGKKGHFIILHWTGNKVTVKNGDMWEVKARVSDKPVIELKE